MEAKENLHKFQVGSTPTLFYVPAFITDSEQEQLLNNIYQAPVSKWKPLKNRRLQNWGGVVHDKGLLPQDLPSWLTRITQRIYEESRMFPSAINHVLINEYLPNQGIMPHQDGPAYFPVVAILSLGSPVVMDFTPHFSLRDCSTTMSNNIEDKVSEKALERENDGLLEKFNPFSVVLMPRSLLIFKDEAYSDYLHGIKDCDMQQYSGAVNAAETLGYHGIVHPLIHLVKANEVNEVTRGEGCSTIHRTSTRVSMTCRVVSNVHKNLFKF